MGLAVWFWGITGRYCIVNKNSLIVSTFWGVRVAQPENFRGVV